jgi:hypothetical protein
MKAIFEAIEVDTPTRFIIVPAKFEAPSNSEKNASEKISQVNDAMEGFAELIEEGMEGIKSKVKKEIKKKLHRKMPKTWYLYLIDEYDQSPVTSESDVYPIPIKVMTEKFKKDILPLMVIGLKGMKCLDTGLRLAFKLHRINFFKKHLEALHSKM